MSQGLFEIATRNKLRVETNAGVVGVEDLWDLSLNRLNDIAIKLNREVKAAEEEDFLKETSAADETTVAKFEVVLHILNVKKQERADQAKEVKNQAAKEKLMSALVRKQDESLDNMSEAEIKKAIKKL